MRSRLAVLLLLVALAAACAGVPTGGGVHLGRELPVAGGVPPPDPTIDVPAPPKGGMSRTELVEGFLRAMISDAEDFRLAHEYLTAHAQRHWDFRTNITTYADSGVHLSTGPGRAVTFRAPRTGVIHPLGEFAPRAGNVHVTFRLHRVGGEWRINRLPDGVLMSTTDAQRSFVSFDVYYVDRSGTRLVPEPVLVRRSQAGVPTALVDALVSGPGRWLAPAVQTGFPEGTEVAGTVPLDGDGDAEVSLTSAVRQASPAQVRFATAQLVWTLRQITGVRSITILGDGVPLEGTTVAMPVDGAWPTFDPAAAPTVTGGVFRSGARWRSIGASPAVRTVPRLQRLAVSSDGSHYAGLRVHRAATSLVVGGRAQRPRVVLRAASISTPTFSPSGDVLVIASRHGSRSVLAVTPAGDVSRSDIPHGLAHGVIRQVRLARDGARVAVIVGPAGASRLLVGRVVQRADRYVLSGFRTILPARANVRGVSWNGGDQIVVTAVDVAGHREVLGTDVVGYAQQTVGTSTLPGQPVDVAACPGQPLLVRAGRFIWQETDAGDWRKLARGSEPVYPD